MIKYLNQVYYLATWKLSSLMRNVFTLLHEQILMTRWWSSILPNRNPKVRPIRVSIFSADCTFLSLGLLSVPEDWEEAVPLCDRLLRRRWLWRIGRRWGGLLRLLTRCMKWPLNHPCSRGGNLRCGIACHWGWNPQLQFPKCVKA